MGPAFSLEREGHVVIEAADGAAALDLMERNASRIDLLVTDLIMPGVSGRELIARFRERHSGVPIICMTGFAPEREMSSPLAPEVHTVLAKPSRTACSNAQSRQRSPAMGH